MKETYDIKGVKLYTAEWHGDSKGWRLNDPAAYKCFELCEKLGIKNMHVHKGPTIIPLNKDAFDVHDVDHAATDFPGPQLDRRALRAAAARRFLLDRGPGDQRLWRPRRGAAVHPRAGRATSPR